MFIGVVIFVADRRSISAKHNTENGKPGVSAPPTITKSYTSTKKEELLKVINEAKQKLDNVSFEIFNSWSFFIFVLF